MREKGYYYLPVRLELLDYTRMMLIRQLLLKYSEEIKLDCNNIVLSNYDKDLKKFKKKMLYINGYKTSDLKEAISLKQNRNKLEERINDLIKIRSNKEKEKAIDKLIEALRKKDEKFYLEYMNVLTSQKDEITKIIIEEYIEDTAPKTIEEYNKLISYIRQNFEKELGEEFIRSLKIKKSLLEGKEVLLDTLDKGTKAIGDFFNKLRK